MDGADHSVFTCKRRGNTNIKPDLFSVRAKKWQIYMTKNRTNMRKQQNKAKIKTVGNTDLFSAHLCRDSFQSHTLNILSENDHIWTGSHDNCQSVLRNIQINPRLTVTVGRGLL